MNFENKNNKPVEDPQVIVSHSSFPYGRQNNTDKDIQAISEDFSNYVGSKYTVAGSNRSSIC